MIVELNDDGSTRSVTRTKPEEWVEPSAETVAAARVAFERYQAAYWRASSTNSFTVADFEPYVAGGLLDQIAADDGRLYRDGSWTNGAARTTSFGPQMWNPEDGTLTAVVCEDLTGVQLLSPTGEDITHLATISELMSWIEVDGLPDNPRVVGYVRYPEVDECTVTD